MDTTIDVARASLEAELIDELKFRPTHIIDENGLTEITAVPEKPSPILVALMEEPGYLATGLTWSGLAVAARIECVLAVGLAPSLALTASVLDAMPEQTRLWLTGWQMQINEGSCWKTAGSIGRQADALIEAGFLLCAAGPTTNWVGSRLCTRDDITPGRPGSPLFVKTIMGQAYLDWISLVE